MQTKKRRGKPKQTWDNEVAEILKRKGVNWRDAKALAQNRKDWKSLLKTGESVKCHHLHQRVKRE